MELHRIFIVGLGLGLSLGCRPQEKPAVEVKAPPPPELAASAPFVASAHFIGAAQIGANTNSAELKGLLTSPEAGALKEQTFQKLARAPYTLLRQRMTEGTNDFAAGLRPLLDDLLREESYFEMRGATRATPELALAVHLDAARAQVWKTNLAGALAAWTAMPVKDIQSNGTAGWELSKHRPPNVIRFVRAGDWVVLGCGQDALPLNDEIVRRVQTQGRPTAAAQDYWLSARVDWPRLSPWMSLPAGLELPQTVLKAAGRGGNLRTEVTVIYPERVNWKFEPWQIPTNTIHERLVSFTAVRGIEPWLDRQPWLQPFKWDPVPNQACLWAMETIPFQTFVAVPAPKADAALERLSDAIAASWKTSWQRFAIGEIVFKPEEGKINWDGLPFITPFVQIAHEPAGDFMYAGMFPNLPSTNALPAELLAQFNRTNLLYYNWEITAERLPEWRNFSQLFLMLAERPQLEGDSTAAKWLNVTGPRLGNAVTEATPTGPNELTLVRKAPLGLTAGELTVLANWLEATNFPWCGYHLPAHTNTAKVKAATGP